MKAYLDILKLCWPLAIGMVNNAMLEFTDRAFLAHESMASLEAILPASMLALISLGFFQSVVAYSGTFVAQYHGAKNERGCVMSYYAGVWIAILSGLFMVALVPCGGFVFETFSNGAEVIARQKTYYNICTVGGVFLFGQMAAQAYFTGRGRTQLVLWVNILGNVANVVFDWIMIFGHFGCPAMGIAGAAYATVLSTMLEWVVLAVVAHRETSLVKANKLLTVEMRSLIVRVLRFGIPSGGCAVMNILSFTIFVFFTGRVGHVEAAVSNACFSINYLLIAPMEGFALGASTLCGQAKGARRDDEAMRAGWRTTMLGLLFVAIASAVVLVFNRQILSLFASQVGEHADKFYSLGFTLVVLMVIWELFDAAEVIISGALKGVGDTKFVFWWILIGAFGFWLPLVYVVSLVHDTMPALWSTLVAYVILLFFGTLWRWHRGRWRGIRLIS